MPCIIGSEKYPDCGIPLNDDNDDCSHGYGQIEKFSRIPSKNDIPQPYLYDNAFTSTNVNAAGEATIGTGYNLYVFDIQYL